MKQIAQNYKSGELTVLDVPAPVCRPGGVLVQSLFSLISTGTEMMKLTEAKMSMVGKARARPDQVRKVIDSVAQQGAVVTYKKVMSRLDSYTPLGYSLCGAVVEVGRGAEEFRVGQLVAAAGNEYALHAEYNWIPANLCAAVPRGVSPEHAAFSTVGAIAMHGVRRAEVQLGDSACVIGLGLVGQLVVRLLLASGVGDIGKTRLDLPWNAYYDKELDVRFSRSYGPGRYDDRYELEGIDYPAGYVRWTERRNLECFLDLVARKDIEVESLISGVFPLENATAVYHDLAAGSLDAVGVLLEYPARPEDSQPRSASLLISGGRPATPRGTSAGQLAIGFIGAGNYASSMLLPHLARLKTVRLAHVATTRSLSAVNAQRRFGFPTASTSADAVLEDTSLDAIFIVTRHHTHADLVCRALETGKAVFVEKPLALTRDELQRILDTVTSTGNDRLMVGFNRRFAPLLGQMRSQFGQPGSGSAIRYLVNAGRLDAGSWYRNEELEGSRFTGEGGHFIDTLAWWTGALPEEVYAVPGAEQGDLHATVRFQNGSSGTISYITTGNPRYPKETLDAAAGGRSARLDNFEKAAVWVGRRRSTARSRGGQDKGQRLELARFVEASRTGAPMPIPLESLVATTRATIAVGESLSSGRPVQV